MSGSGEGFTCSGPSRLCESSAAFSQSQFVGHLIKRQTAESTPQAVSSDGSEELRSQEKWADAFLYSER